MEFLSTGVLTIKKDVYTDLFLVGGGGGGVMISNINNGGGSGGSGIICMRVHKE